MTQHRRTIATIAVSAALLAGLAACGSSDVGAGGAPTSAGSTTSATGTPSAADVAFAQSMIPHHQQAVQMADLALDPASQASAEVAALAARIKEAQDPEIQTMTAWLHGWGQPTAMPGASSAADLDDLDMSGHDMAGMVVSGMMTDEELAALADASGTAFDQMWLTMMIAHHKGAIAMALSVQGTTTDEAVAALASDIVTAQQAEIATMRDLLP